MTEPREWLVVQGDVWHLPQRRDSVSPIRRGTARRLGLDLPPPVKTITITPDLNAFNRAFNEAFRARLAIVEAGQAAIGASFQRIAKDIAAIRGDQGGAR